VPRLFLWLNLLDDCSRLHLGTRLCERELLLAHLDFLPRLLHAYGLPLELYVDYHPESFRDSSVTCPPAAAQRAAARPAPR